MTTVKWSRRRDLILFALLVVAFLLLAYRSEVNAHNIERDAYDTCRARNVNVERATQLYEGLIAIEKDNPFVSTSPSTIHRRIQLYRDAIPSPVDCEGLS